MSVSVWFHTGVAVCRSCNNLCRGDGDKPSMEEGVAYGALVSSGMLHMHLWGVPES